MLYTINLLRGDYDEVFKSSNMHNLDVDIYSNHLQALIFITDSRLSIESSEYQKLTAATQQSTDFHFETLQNQINDIKYRLHYNSEENANSESVSTSKKLGTGDFVVTRHSNLQIAQIVIHLIIDKKNSVEMILKGVLRGLSNILKIAVQYDVKVLTLPSSLISANLTHLFTENQILKHCESVFRTVKAFIVNSTKSLQDRIHTVQFILPSEKSLSQKIRNLVVDLKQ